MSFKSFGAIQGRVELSAKTSAGAALHARAVYDDAEGQDFCGDAVLTDELPDWAPELESWLPTSRLAEIGFRLADDPQLMLVSTYGVDQHIDNIHGPVLCLVLHNDGLTFRQGRQSHKTEAGEWFVFDDAADHGVKEARGRGAYVTCTVALERLN